ncbi:hypothetical protein NX059_003283 [Plenodomus lindquistii]|nr:hypothetical protein NX059_003283 [Plenodomus lindquistii]
MTTTMPSRSLDGRSRKDSTGSLPLSTSSNETGSIATIPSTDMEPDWPQTWRAYACMLGCVLLMFNSWGLVNAYGTWSSYYVGHSLRTSDQLRLNLIGSTQSGIVLFLSNPVGRLLDAGHFRKVIGCGTVLVPLGLFLLSIVHPSDVEAITSYGPIWATQGLVVGLGMSTFFVSSSQIASTWFPKRRGLAVGYVACGASIAGVVYPSMLRYLIDLVGFNNAVRYVATLTSVTCLFSFIFCTPNPAHDHHEPKRWAAIGTWFDVEAFRNPAFCWFTAAIAFLFWGFYPVFFNLEEWASVRGFGLRIATQDANEATVGDTSNKPMETFWLLTIMNGASTIGRILLAHFADVVGALNMHIGSTLIGSLLILILWSLAGSETDAIVFCVVFGLFSGMIIGCPPASVGNILNCTYKDGDHKPSPLAKKKLGHWTGMMYFFAGAPAITGPLIAGHLITKYDTYLTVQMWSGACLVVCFCCMMVARWYLPSVNGRTSKEELVLFLTTREGFKSAFRKPDLSPRSRQQSQATMVNATQTLSQVPTQALSQAPTRVPSTTSLQHGLSEKTTSPGNIV